MRTFIICMLAILLLGCSSYQQPGQPPGGNQTLPKSNWTGGSAIIHISGFSFQPASITITQGTNVTWINDDPTFHTVTADNGSFNSGNLQHGDNWSFVFGNFGEYKYHCAIHPSMKGTIIVNEKMNPPV
jgi:plastocyanin